MEKHKKAMPNSFQNSIKNEQVSNFQNNETIPIIIMDNTIPQAIYITNIPQHYHEYKNTQVDKLLTQ